MIAQLSLCLIFNSMPSKNFTSADLEKMKCAGLNGHLIKPPSEVKKASKYKNEKAVDEFGNKYDSKKELKRGKELKLLLKVGHIGFLARQVEFQLNTGGSHNLKYIADFIYTDAKTGEIIVEDVKGFETKEFKKKEKLMKKIHGIIIKIT